jgi:hypothetical protein
MHSQQHANLTIPTVKRLQEILNIILFLIKHDLHVNICQLVLTSHAAVRPTDNGTSYNTDIKKQYKNIYIHTTRALSPKG